MAGYIYVNVTTHGTHEGYEDGGISDYLRDMLDGSSHSIIAFFKVILNENVDFNLKNLYAVVNSCFSVIGSPDPTEQYNQKCSNGSFELKCSDTLFKTSQKVNERLEIAFNNLNI